MPSKRPYPGEEGRSLRAHDAGRHACSRPQLRGRVDESYQSRIDHLFTPEAKDIVNPHNRTIIARFDEAA